MMLFILMRMWWLILVCSAELFSLQFVLSLDNVPLLMTYEILLNLERQTTLFAFKNILHQPFSYWQTFLNCHFIISFDFLGLLKVLLTVRLSAWRSIRRTIRRLIWRFRIDKVTLRRRINMILRKVEIWSLRLHWLN